MTKQDSLDLLQSLKESNCVTVSYYGGTKTFAPYKPGTLKSGDLVIVLLDRRAKYLESSSSEIELANKYSDVVADLDNSLYVIEMGEITSDKVFNALFRRWSQFPFVFTEDMIYGKAIDRDLLFSNWELCQKTRRYNHANSQPDSSFSKLEVQYYLLSPSFSQSAWEISASKIDYQDPREFWIDCVYYLEPTAIDRFYPDEVVANCICEPLAEAAVKEDIQRWFKSARLTETPDEVFQLDNIKHAMEMTWGPQPIWSILAEKDEKWFAFMWQTGDNDY